ncbi:MAG: hypothetical protein ACRC22_09730, partial [Shewanella sp.]
MFRDKHKLAAFINKNSLVNPVIRGCDDGQHQFDTGLAITQQLAAELARSAQSVSQLQLETERIDEVVIVISSIAE